MPNKIKSKAQMRLMQGVAHGMKPRKGGPSKETAEEILSKEHEVGGYKNLPEHVKKKSKSKSRGRSKR